MLIGEQKYEGEPEWPRWKGEVLRVLKREVKLYKMTKWNEENKPASNGKERVLEGVLEGFGAESLRCRRHRGTCMGVSFKLN